MMFLNCVHVQQKINLIGCRHQKNCNNDSISMWSGELNLTSIFQFFDFSFSAHTHLRHILKQKKIIKFLLHNTPILNFSPKTNEKKILLTY